MIMGGVSATRPDEMDIDTPPFATPALPLAEPMDGVISPAIVHVAKNPLD